MAHLEEVVTLKITVVIHIMVGVAHFRFVTIHWAVRVAHLAAVAQLQGVVSWKSIGKLLRAMDESPLEPLIPPLVLRLVHVNATMSVPPTPKSLAYLIFNMGTDLNVHIKVFWKTINLMGKQIIQT